jgi:lipid-A-disaccharide synthase
MRRNVDHVLCCLPFEEAWFREHGCNATFVGHPFFDEVRHHPYDERFLESYGHQDRPLVTILPGSRNQEVKSNLQWFLKAAHEVRRAVPDVRFAFAAFKPGQAEIVRKEASASGLAADVFVGKTPELMRLADCCMSVSGSVSLELLYHAKPTVILYWISSFAYWVQGFFRRVKYITLVNLLSTGELHPKDLAPFDPAQPDADKVLFPEYLTCEDKSREIANHVIQWLTDPVEREVRVRALQSLREAVGHGGASAQAAEYILDVLGLHRPALPRPHFLPRATVATEPLLSETK